MEEGTVYPQIIYSLNIVYKESRLLKYLVKNLREFKKDDRSFGKRLVIKSKNLRRPKEYTGNYQELLSSIYEKNETLELVDKDAYKSRFLKEVEASIFKK